jgi:hypothetical protein
MTVFSLSLHAEYACRHSGKCCTAGWNIPVETELRNLLGTDTLTPDTDGICRYFERDSHLCHLHRRHGHDALPLSCRQFPRRALIDDRGIFITLSHFCPTAAALLFQSAKLVIVEHPAAFPANDRYDGLDARGTWPPLLKPDVLFDLRSYSRWERFGVETLGGEGSVRRALAQIAAAAERLRSWTADRGGFDGWAARTLQTNTTESGPDTALPSLYGVFEGTGAYRELLAMIEPRSTGGGLDPRVDDVLTRMVLPVWDRFAAPIKRYLASKLFGSWSAYQAQGIRTHVAELIVSELVVRIEAAKECADRGRSLDMPLLLEAFRAADRLLVHAVDRAALLRWLGRAERRS